MVKIICDLLLLPSFSVGHHLLSDNLLNYSFQCSITKELDCLSSFLQASRVSALLYRSSVLCEKPRKSSQPVVLLQFTPVLQPPADLSHQPGPRGASCWNNKCRSGQVWLSQRDLRKTKQHGAKSRRYRCHSHIFPTHCRHRILGRRHHCNTSIFIPLLFQSMIRPHRGTVEGYFLAGKYMFWLPVSDENCSSLSPQPFSSGRSLAVCWEHRK